jgi:hypothetical protein
MLNVLKYLPSMAILALPAVAYAQASDDLSLPLMQGANCISSVSHSWNSFDNDETRSVVIDNQLFSSQFQLYAYNPSTQDPQPFVKLACEIDVSRYDRLEVQFGVADEEANDNPSITVNFLEGGTILRPYNDIGHGKIYTDTINLTGTAGVSRFTIEMLCNSSGYDCNLDFIRAQLMPTSTYIVPPDVQSNFPAPGTEPLTPDPWNTNTGQGTPVSDDNSVPTTPDVGTELQNTILETLIDAGNDALGDALEDLLDFD